jgi:DNA polymerase-3 subunit delta'
MAKFAKTRGVEQRRIDLAGGSPGVAISLDLAQYERRRTAMFALLRVAAGLDPFGAWLKHSEAIGRSRSEKLEPYLKALYALLRDVMLLRESAGAIQNSDMRRELEPVARAVSGVWIRSAVKKVDELVELLRRNIQKTIALDALILELRAELKPASAPA